MYPFNLFPEIGSCQKKPMLAWFFSATAWPMEAKLPYSPFHLILTAAGCALAVSCALWCARSPRIRPSRLLASCGLSLALLELYKTRVLMGNRIPPHL